jgi:hypothetical protein
MTRSRVLAAGGLLAAVVGCSGGPSFAPVSGVVKLDGEPYSHAVVSFQPVGSSDNPNPGRGSSAYTDAQGRFVLRCDNAFDGAVVGKHLVRIMTRGNDVVGQDPTQTSPDGAPPHRKVDPIPPEWNALSTVEFEVPAGGTTKADFNIPTKKGKAR